MHLKIFSLSLIVGPKFWPPGPPLPRGDIFKIESLHPGAKWKSTTKNEVDWLNTFCAMLLTDTHTRTHTHTRTDTQSDCKKPLAGFSKSSDPDNIPNRTLQELGPDLAPMLTLLFTQSITTGELPEDWRNANIPPIFKKGDRHIMSNYRPVSLTCVCCKLEYIICHHVREHLDKHDMLTPL